MVSGDNHRRAVSERRPHRRDRRGRRDHPNDPEPARERGQTTLDFAVGVSVLLLTLATVFLFVPGALGVFTDGGQADIVSSNRIASSLSEGLLGDPSRPFILNRTCTVEFFDDDSPAHCRHAGSNLSERVGLDRLQTANVTIRSNLSSDADGSDILCWNGSALVERDAGGCSVELRIGPAEPAGSTTSVTARRIVEIEGTDATLLVVVW